MFEAKQLYTTWIMLEYLMYITVGKIFSEKKKINKNMDTKMQ